MPIRLRLPLVTTIVALMATLSATAGSVGQAAEPRFLLAHYMPWFEGRPVSAHWGWHWTMQAFDPEQQINGQPSIASHFHPLIGPYDSSDPAVLEFHLLTMKLAGIDGVIVDWYGLTSFRDYAVLHRNTTRLLETAERLQMKFVICYEDQTIPALVAGNRLAAEGRVRHAATEIEWLGKYWFKSPSYLKLGGKPVLLSFGQTGLTDAEWTACLELAGEPVAYFSQQLRRSSADGAFDWPTPSETLPALDRFYRESPAWPASIPVAFPRFKDIYAEAKVGPSYGRFDDDGGRSFRSLLERALRTKAPIVQIATWNDWGEGTLVEPSVEFGYRDLEATQELRRRHLERQFPHGSEELRLPLEIHRARRQSPSESERKALDRIVEQIVAGDVAAAAQALRARRDR
ncbi:MAG: glycoside hydrolase family 71/99-like protein [Planctomycetaceae bacterium]